jgi:RNA polymerase sigma factor (sigma-70 family)
VADRIAHEESVPSIHRTHLLRLREGKNKATEEKIYIVLAAIREITGIMFGVGELFAVEPATAGAPVPFRKHGHDLLPPVSSAGSRIAHLWRVLVTEDPAPSSDQAFETLYVEHGALLRAIAMRRYDIPPDDAEALVHDCFIAYLERHTTIHDVKAWLSGAMRNSCVDYLRVHQREAPLLPEHDDTADPAPGSNVESWVWKLTFASVLARLNAKCRETLRSHYLTNEPEEALADRLSTSTGYVRRLISICRGRVREAGRSLGIFKK